MLNFSLIILVFRLTNSNTVTATFLLMAMIPAIIFGVFAGVVADRFDKRKILLFCDLAIGLVMLLFIPFAGTPPLILTVAFLLNVIFQFFIPAEAAALPTIVPRENLLAANSIFQFTPTAALIVGSTAAGPIVANFGYNPVFIFGASAMVATFFIRRALPALPPEKHMAFNIKTESLVRLIVLSKVQIREGIRFILSDKYVWVPILTLSFIQAAGSTIAVLAPGFMEQILRIEATDSSLILLLPFGIGLGLGAFLTATAASKTPVRIIVIRGMLICGLAIIAMALTPVVGASLAHKEFLARHIRPFSKAFTVSIWISFFATFVGFGAAQVVIPMQTILQKNTLTRFRGRVFAVWSTLIAMSVSVPALAAGAIADILGVIWAMVLVGICVVAAGLLGLRRFF